MAEELLITISGHPPYNPVVNRSWVLCYCVKLCLLNLTSAISCGKVYISENILAYSHIPNLIFVNVLDIKENYGLNIQNIRKRSFPGFSNITIVGKIFGNIYELVHYFQNMIELVPVTRGYTNLFFLGSNIFFPAGICLFDMKYFSKCLNHSENPCKMTNTRPRVLYS